MKAGENTPTAWKESKQDKTQGTRLFLDHVTLRSYETPVSPILLCRVEIILCWLTLELGVGVTWMIHYTIRNHSHGV